MKIKIVIALLTAIFMAATTGCEKNNEDIKTPAEKTEQSVSVTSAAEASSAESSEASESQSDSSENTSVTDSVKDRTDSKEDTGPAAVEASSERFIDDKNCVIFDHRKEEDKTEYDKEKIYRMAELAARQYNCIIEKDIQGYFGEVNIPAVMVNDRIKNYTSELRKGTEMSETESNHYSKTVSMILSLSDIDLASVYRDLAGGEIDDDEASKRIYDTLLEGAEKISAGDIEDIDDKIIGKYADITNAPSDIYDLPDKYTIHGTDDLICKVVINGYISENDITCADIDIEYMLGENKYVLQYCNIWLYEDQSSTYLDRISIRDNKKAMTLDDIYKQEEENVSLNEFNTTAKYAYNAAAEFFADSETRGISMNQAIENGDFRLANSSDGLELKDSYPAEDKEGKGDALIINMISYLMETSEKRGWIYLGITEIDGYERFFVQYKNEEGLIGQYPNPLDADEEKSITWKEYLPE